MKKNKQPKLHNKPKFAYRDNYGDIIFVYWDKELTEFSRWDTESKYPTEITQYPTYPLTN